MPHMPYMQETTYPSCPASSGSTAPDPCDTALSTRAFYYPVSGFAAGQPARRRLKSIRGTTRNSPYPKKPVL
jgi:hypothetical protein